MSPPAPSTRAAAPPEMIDAGVVVLERNRPADVAAVARAVTESLDHLQPWMPWATPEGGTVEAQTAHIHKVDVGWETRTDYSYLLRAPGAGPASVLGMTSSVLGMIGLHRRLGPGAIEIGYWAHVAHSGRGYMTAAARAVTEAAAALADVDRVEIHTDEANLRSAAIPGRLGSRLERVDPRRPEAPAESGRLQIWVWP